MRTDLPYVISLDMRSVIPPLHAIVQLFDDQLVDVSFPGIDQTILADACDQIAERRRAVEDVRSALDEAERRLEATLEDFKSLGRRALAYAEVYADGDVDLCTRINEIRDGLGLDEGGASAPAKAVRRRKKKRNGPELPLSDRATPPAEPASAHESAPSAASDQAA